MPFTASTVSGAVSSSGPIRAGLGGTSSLNASSLARVNRPSTSSVISRGYWKPAKSSAIVSLTTASRSAAAKSYSPSGNGSSNGQGDREEATTSRAGRAAGATPNRTVPSRRADSASRSRCAGDSVAVGAAAASRSRIAGDSVKPCSASAVSESGEVTTLPNRPSSSVNVSICGMSTTFGSPRPHGPTRDTDGPSHPVPR